MLVLIKIIRGIVTLLEIIRMISPLIKIIRWMLFLIQIMWRIPVAGPGAQRKTLIISRFNNPGEADVDQ